MAVELYNVTLPSKYNTRILDLDIGVGPEIQRMLDGKTPITEEAILRPLRMYMLIYTRCKYLHLNYSDSRVNSQVEYECVRCVSLYDS